MQVRKQKQNKEAGSVVEWRMVDPGFCEQGDKWNIEEKKSWEEVVEKNKGLNEILR